MNRRDAKQRNLPPGYAVRIEAESGPVTYLSANGYDHTTELPVEAMWFETVEDASRMAASLSASKSRRRWIVTTVPAPGPWDGLDPYREAYEDVFGPEDDGWFLDIPHVHTRDCYDDPGPGHGSPQLICNNGETQQTAWGVFNLNFSGRN